MDYIIYQLLKMSTFYLDNKYRSFGKMKSERFEFWLQFNDFLIIFE